MGVFGGFWECDLGVFVELVQLVTGCCGGRCLVVGFDVLDGFGW